MKARCFYRNTPQYSDYGGRGITVCERWAESFDHFYADMGPCPEGFSIDRVNTDGNYEPENCRWATRSEQQRNRRANRYLTANGCTLLLTDWSNATGIKVQTILGRLHHGWSEERALTTPVQKYARR
jgi:hypothetical protein